MLLSEVLDPTGGQIEFLGRDFRVEQSTPCKTWGFVDMETTNKHAKTQKYTRVLARRSQLFFQQGLDGISQSIGGCPELKTTCRARFSGSLCTQHYHLTCLDAQTKMKDHKLKHFSPKRPPKHPIEPNILSSKFTQTKWIDIIQNQYYYIINHIRYLPPHIPLGGIVRAHLGMWRHI